MNWKKLGAFICAAALLVAITAGCSTPPEKTETVNSADNTGDITGSITIWEHGFSFEESTKQIVDGYKKQYPDVDVEYEIKEGSEYYSLLSTAIQSGEGPDLFWTNGTATANMSDYAANNVCADLSDDVDFSLFDEAILKICTIDGKQYSVPWLTLDTRSVYYNKDMFEENGWELPKTFSEFEALLKTIKGTGKIPISLCGTDTYTLLFAFEPILAAFDVEYSKGLADYTSKPGDQAAADALNKMIEWADKGYFGDKWLGVSDGSAQMLAFTSGEAAMDIAGSWSASNIRENNPDLNFGAFQIPSEDGTTGLVGTPANGFSVNTASKNLSTAISFANYCATKEAQTIWVQAQGSVSASPEIEPSTEIAKEIAQSGGGNLYTSWQAVIAHNSSSGNAVTIWDENFPKVFSGDITVKDFLQSISEEMD